jgi:hypothetical protein
MSIFKCSAVQCSAVHSIHSAAAAAATVAAWRGEERKGGVKSIYSIVRDVKE